MHELLKKIVERFNKMSKKVDYGISKKFKFVYCKLQNMA